MKLSNNNKKNIMYLLLITFIIGILIYVLDLSYFGSIFVKQENFENNNNQNNNNEYNEDELTEEENNIVYDKQLNIGDYYGFGNIFGSHTELNKK